MTVHAKIFMLTKFIILLGANGVVHVKGDSFRISLGDVMIFTTGVATEPPLGFSNKPNIKFCDGSFPRANTCINALYLPLPLNSEDDFTYNMCFGILNAAGYGQV